MDDHFCYGHHPKSLPAIFPLETFNPIAIHHPINYSPDSSGCRSCYCPPEALWHGSRGRTSSPSDICAPLYVGTPSTIPAFLGAVIMATPASAEPPALIPRQTLFSNPDRASVQLSPDGQRISYLAPLHGVLNVWVGPADSPQSARPV